MMQGLKERILLSHGDGGALTQRLVSGVFLKHFQEGRPAPPPADAAVFHSRAGRAALTTDSFVVNPLFFPGGDIGKLAVCGTVNDLAVSGAVPLFLTAAFIIEEGFAVERLEKIAASMAAAARQAGVEIVAGDTKVVGRGQADGVYITTTGYGLLREGVETGFHRIAAGDRVLVNGPVGEHGLAILVRRERLERAAAGRFRSDCAPLSGITGDLLQGCPGIKFMRDLTRGGLATAVKETAAAAGVDIILDETAIPVRQEAGALAEMLGLDPLYLANEGKFLAVVDGARAGEALACLRGHPLGRRAAVIGKVKPGKGNACLKTALGGTKFLDLFAGEPLPRIC